MGFLTANPPHNQNTMSSPTQGIAERKGPLKWSLLWGPFCKSSKLSGKQFPSLCALKEWPSICFTYKILLWSLAFSIDNVSLNHKQPIFSFGIYATIESFDGDTTIESSIAALKLCLVQIDTFSGFLVRYLSNFTFQSTIASKSIKKSQIGNPSDAKMATPVRKR